MTTIDPIALIHQISVTQAKHAALMAEMLEAMDTINELQRSKNMSDKPELEEIYESEYAHFRCKVCFEPFRFPLSVTLSEIEAARDSHECRDTAFIGYTPSLGKRIESQGQC